MSVNRVFINYTKDLETYLTSKLPDVPIHTLMEIAEYIGNKTAVLSIDLLRERDREWKMSSKRYRTDKLNEPIQNRKEASDIHESQSNN